MTQEHIAHMKTLIIRAGSWYENVDHSGWVLVALASTVCTGCVICQYTGPEQCTGGFGESETGRGFAATPAPPGLVRNPARGTFLRDLASLEIKKTSFLDRVSKAIWW